MACERHGPTVLDDAFEELALALGGVIATHAVPDDAVWDLARVIDHTRRRARAALTSRIHEGRTVMPQSTHAAHPAITLLLRRLRENDESPLSCELPLETRS